MDGEEGVGFVFELLSVGLEEAMLVAGDGEGFSGGVGRGSEGLVGVEGEIVG